MSIPGKYHRSEKFTNDVWSGRTPRGVHYRDSFDSFDGDEYPFRAPDQTKDTKLMLLDISTKIGSFSSKLSTQLTEVQTEQKTIVGALQELTKDSKEHKEKISNMEDRLAANDDHWKTNNARQAENDKRLVELEKRVAEMEKQRLFAAAPPPASAVGDWVGPKIVRKRFGPPGPCCKCVAYGDPKTGRCKTHPPE